MNDSDYEILDFHLTVEKLRFVYDRDERDKIRALQFTIGVYFENLKQELAGKEDQQKASGVVVPFKKIHKT